MVTAIALLFISSVFVAVGVYLRQKGDYLTLHGKKAEAIIVANNYKSDSSDDGYYYPVVKFLTDQQQWVTQELSIGYTPAKPEGSTLQVIYDPDDLTCVEINSSFFLKTLPLILIALGTCGIIVIALMYLDIIPFSFD